MKEFLFEDDDFESEDSDGDGRSNAVEFAADTDPADNISEDSSGSTGTSGGCGFITTPPSSGSGTGKAVLIALMLLPIALLSRLRMLNK